MFLLLVILSQDIPKNLNFPAGIPYFNQILTFSLIKLLTNEKTELQTTINDPLTNVNPMKIGSNARLQKPQTGGTPLKETSTNPNKKKTPIKTPIPMKQFQFEEEIKDHSPPKENEFEETKEVNINKENSDSFMPMGRAANDLKKNPWSSSQHSKKSLISSKPKNELPEKEEPIKKVNKRLDLNVLKQKPANETKVKKETKETKTIKQKQSSNNAKEKSPENNNEDYYEKSSKFNTVTDPRIFAPENLALNKWNSNEDISENGEANEIEENIKENESMRTSKPIHNEKEKPSLFKSPDKRDIGTNYQNKKGEISQEMVTVDDVLAVNESPEIKESKKKNVYEEELDKIIKEEIRPYSPPFDSNKKSNSEFKQTFGSITPSQKNMLEVVYDPVLNCYYDPKTNSYYDLIN